MMWLFCLIFGHNKTLRRYDFGECDEYHTVCSQCKKRWINNELTKKPRKQIIQKITKKENNLEKPQEIVVSQKPILKKQVTNIYVL